MAWSREPGGIRCGTSAWKNLRTQTLTRDGCRCTRCGATDHLEADHIISYADGGMDTLNNLRTLCHDCHQAETKQQSAAGRARRASRRRLPQRDHPGLA